MSLRKIARILGVSPAYLSRMVNGKRPWNPEIRERYVELVSVTLPEFGNTFGNTKATGGDSSGDRHVLPASEPGRMVELGGLEPPTSSMPLKRSPR